MKKYTIKNYKGNIIESLSRFQKNHKGMRIVEACEDEEELKIKVTEAFGSRFNFGRGGISLDKFNKDKLYTIFYCGYDDEGSYYVNCGENIDQQELTKKLKKELSKLKKSYYATNRGPLENDEYEIYTTNKIEPPLDKSMSLEQMLKYQKFRKIFSDDLLKKIDVALENEALSLYAVEALFGEGNFYIIELDK